MVIIWKHYLLLLLGKKKIEAAQEGMAVVSDASHGFLCLFDYIKMQKLDSLANVKPEIIKPIKKNEEGTTIIITKNNINIHIINWLFSKLISKDY